MVQLSVRSITVKYGRFTALEDLSFDVLEGEIFGLIGPNGCGKSTCLKVLCGILKPNEGSIFFQGREVKPWKKELSKVIGYAPQENSFFEKLTVKENLEYFANLYNLKGDLDDLISRVLEYLGIAEKIDTLAKNLSGGMKRRLNVACSILHNPKILILDEPSIMLDPVSRDSLWRLIKSINRKGTTIILATNTMEEARALCKRIVLMERGKAKAIGKTENILMSMGLL